MTAVQSISPHSEAAGAVTQAALISTRAVKHPEWLSIRLKNGLLTHGPNQSWYKENYRRQRGCGPTTAALIAAYIARKPDMVSLYKPYKGLSRSAGFIAADYVLGQEEMLAHMDEMWRYVKPSPFGLWRSSMMSRGFTDYTSARGVPLDTRRFLVSWLKSRNSKLWIELIQFLRHNLVYDIPIAWLIYDKGKLTQTQSWHWVSVIGITYASDNSSCSLEIIDHQRKYDVNLEDWFKHSKLGGAFVAFRPMVNNNND